MKDIPQAGKDLIKGFETDVLRVYDDRQPKVILTANTPILGVLTGGYGHTDPTLKWDTPVDQPKADMWFEQDSLSKVTAPLYRKIGDIVDELTDNQYSALCSFVYNLGTGNPQKPEWSIWKIIRAKQFDQVPQQLAKFVNWDGQKSLGLVKRRAAEQVLWSTNEPGTQDVDPPSTVTRQDPTPPTPADPVPVSKSATIITGVAGAVAAGPPLVNQAIQAVQPYADSSDMVKHILGILATLGAVLAVTGIAFAFMMKRNSRN